MWSEFSADARLYIELRWPGDPGTFRRVLICVRSRGLLLLTVQRLSHLYLTRRQQRGWTPQTMVLRVLIALAHRLLVVLTKSDVAATSVFGPGVYLSDRGHLIVGVQRVGSGTLIHHRVTIGVKAGEEVQPIIGENVWIGPDCVIYGAVTLGDGATVLPESVLSMNVPPRAVAAGNPATIILKDFDNSGLRQTLVSDIDRNSLCAR